MAPRFTESVRNLVRDLPVGESIDLATPLSKRKIVNALTGSIKGADGDPHWYHCEAIPNGVRVTRRAGIAVRLVNAAE